MAGEIEDRPGRDDPIWDYVLQTRLMPYIPFAREWWSKVEDLVVHNTGIYDLTGPPGFRYRFTRVAARSPIKGIQAFPFVPTAYLQISGVQGGSTKMVDRVCLDNKFTIDEFTIVCKSNLPSTVQQGQFIAFIPTRLISKIENLGLWLYLKREELEALGRGIILESVKLKVVLKL